MSTSTTPDMKPTIRTVTVFLTLCPENFDVTWGSLFSTEDLDAKISKCANLLRDAQAELQSQGYVVQTLRIATNPFGEWMTSDSSANTTGKKKKKASETSSTAADPQIQTTKKLKVDKLNRLQRLDQLLANHGIEFCSVGPAKTREETKLCVDIVAQSHRFSCSTVVEAANVVQAQYAADTFLAISKLQDGNHVQKGLGNFRFCTASYCQPGIPFFPAATKASSPANNKDDNRLSFAIGLENGPVATKLLKDCKTIANIDTTFKMGYANLVAPIQDIALKVARDVPGVDYLGMDTSLNPSLVDEGGSVAAAMECLEEVAVFGGPGTLAAAAAITKALQSLPNITRTGYCGLMLPVCEDARLAELANKSQLRISNVLSISSVCGVGVDTVPVPETISRDELTSLILDVAGIAGRWNKSLSCRVFPVPGKKQGERTEFDSPYMVNCNVFGLE